MIRIAIICLLISLVSSNNCNLSNDDLNKLTEKLLYSTKKMEITAKNDDAIVVLGLGRCGKSTLINYLMGNKLKGEKSKEAYSRILIVKDNMNSIGPEIGVGSTSKTTDPSKWNSTIFPEMVLWDTPGFDDNRGQVQAITNAFNIQHLLNNLKSVKVVLVVSQNDITGDEPAQFIKFLNFVESLFGDKFEHIFTGISLIFSKATEKIDGIEIDVNYVSQTLQEKFLTPKDLKIHETNKHFLQHMLKNTDRIGFFRKANKEGVLNNIDINIINAIRNSQSINKYFLTDTHPTMAEDSKICLITAQKKKLEQLYNHTEKVRIEIENTINTQKGQIELNRIYKILNETQKFSNDLPEQLRAFRGISKDIEKEIDSFDLPSNLKLVKFVDEMLNTDKLKEADILGKLQTNSLIAEVKNALLSNDVKNITLLNENSSKSIEDEKKNNKKVIAKLSEEYIKLKDKTKNTPFNSSFIISLGAIMSALFFCLFFIN